MNEYDVQANEFAKKYGVKLYSKYIGFEPNRLWGPESNHHWKCTLKRGNSSYTFDFWRGVGCGPGKPTMYDVLSCLQKYDVGEFDDFCKEFGYTFTCVLEYSRAKKIHRGCQKEYKAVMRLFSDCINEIQEIN